MRRHSPLIAARVKDTSTESHVREKGMPTWEATGASNQSHTGLHDQTKLEWHIMKNTACDEMSRASLLRGRTGADRPTHAHAHQLQARKGTGADISTSKCKAQAVHA